MKGDKLRSECVAVRKRRAERARRILLGASLLIKELRPVVKDDEVLFPVRNVEKALRILSGLGLEARPCSSLFARYRRTSRTVKVSGLSSYTIIGEIAIINYRGKDAEKYKRLAERILELHPKVRAVYLKLRTSGPYRLPELVLIEGERVTETEYKEFGLKFRADISKVYVNPRLANEHRRIAELVNENEEILDMFTGIAPFPIHITSLRRARVLAVDLNPHAIYYASLNVKLNRRRLRGDIALMRADARILPEVLANRFDRIIMNNPTAVLEFVPQACKLVKRSGSIHIYKLIGREDVRKVVEKVFLEEGCEVEKIEIRRVREYSPEEKIVVLDVEVKKSSL